MTPIRACDLSARSHLEPATSSARLHLNHDGMPALASIAARDASDRWLRAAVLSGIAGREARFAANLFEKLRDETPGAFDLLGELGVILGRAAVAEKRDVFSNESMPSVERVPT